MTPARDVTQDEDGPVMITKTAKWILLQIPQTQVDRICSMARQFKQFTLTPFNEENKLFVPIENNIRFWLNGEQISSLPDGKSQGKIIIDVKRFTELEDGQVRFKVEVEHVEIMNSTSTALCPFSKV